MPPTTDNGDSPSLPGTGKTVLVTGAAGYVATHCIVDLIGRGFDVVAFDNYSNSVRNQEDKALNKPEAILRIQRMTGKEIPFEEVDMRDPVELKKAIAKYRVDCVLHAAAHKAVAESCRRPLQYYDNNVVGSFNLIRAMDELGIKKFVFSSSSTVYGTPLYLPMDEEHRAGNCTNPYGKTKFMVEEIVKDMCLQDKEWCGMLLRYFNPVGAHPSGDIGEDPLGEPYNLMPFIAQVAVGRRPVLRIFGTDYEDTSDGTAVRDYVHVMDVATGHSVALLEMFKDTYDGGARTYNLGIGRGTTVLELISAFEEASGVKINTEVCGRRKGDVSASFASCDKIEKELGWKAELSIKDMCKDMWTWQKKNPLGYRKKEAMNGDGE